MGSIGHRTLLYDMRNWQIRAALRGYNRQHHTAWECTRQILFCTLKAGHYDVHDADEILPLPWLKQHIATDQPTPEQVEELQRIIREENEKRKH